MKNEKDLSEMAEAARKIATRWAADLVSIMKENPDTSEFKHAVAFLITKGAELEYAVIELSRALATLQGLLIVSEKNPKEHTQ